MLLLIFTVKIQLRLYNIVKLKQKDLLRQGGNVKGGYFWIIEKEKNGDTKKQISISLQE